jgi:hypothetical protein
MRKGRRPRRFIRRARIAALEGVMRWVMICLVAILVALIGAGSAQAVTVKVTIVGADGKPVKGANVRVSLWRSGQPTHDDGMFIGSGKTGEDGSFTLTTDPYGRQPLPGDTYIITAGTSAASAETVVYADPDDKAGAVLTLDPARSSYGFLEDVEQAADAAEKGNTAGYEQNVREAQERIAAAERLADNAQKAADDYARDNGLQVQDLRTVEKTIKTVEKLPEDMQQDKKQHKELIDKLWNYRAKLKDVQDLRDDIGKGKTQLAELKPKYGLVPSACPPGESGGLLAGGINSLFGTDLAGVCDDKQPQHRDTDRQKGGDRHERDEHD